MPGSNRQRDLAKRRAERQSVRRREAAERRRKQRLIIGGSGLGVLALLLAVFFAINRGDDKPAEPVDAAAQTASEEPAPSQEAKPVACGATAPPAAAAPQKFDAAPPMTIDPAKKYSATVKTSCGEFVIDFLADKAPTTVNSFNFLASKKYFDGTRCHRILTGADSVLQCGDPTATGSGDPGYKFNDENLPAGEGGTYVYPPGTVAMANSGPNTNGSQFFVVIKDSPFPPAYTVFGKVTRGLDVLDKLLAVGQAAGTDEPAQEIFIESYTVSAT